MKTIQYNSFGGTDVIELVDINYPELMNPYDVLIEVKAASVNPIDVKIRMGIMQKMRPVQLPYRPGLDVSGIIVAMGPSVKKFKLGDKVMAATMTAGYSEFAIAKEENVSLKPDNIDFSEATSLVVNIGTSESILFSEGKLNPGSTVLIQGAAGSVGATMIQMAKHCNLKVIATATGKGIELAKKLGADVVIDYKKEDLEQYQNTVDLVADCAGGSGQSLLYKTLKKGGKLLSIAGMPSSELADFHQVEARFISSDLSNKNRVNGLKLVTSGHIIPIIAKKFNLYYAANAQELQSIGGLNGKIVLEI